MKNSKFSIDIDMEELLGLSEPRKHSLEYDLNFIMENGIEAYNKQVQEHERKKQEFIELFEECFDEVCDIIRADSQQRIPIECFTCAKGMELRDKYGSPRSE